MNRLVFPTALRKMWSGGEVQKWLDENVKDREFFIEHQILRRALCHCGISAPESDCELGQRMDSYAKQVVRRVAKMDLPLPEASDDDGTTSDKYRAELYDEVWQRARDMGYANVTMALDDLAMHTKSAADGDDDVPMNPCIMQLDKLGDL